MTTLINDRLRVKDKEPGFEYRWVNNRDLHMQDKLDVGWEPVHKPAEDLLGPTAALAGASTSAPGGGTTVTRGDLVLMRMRTEAFEKNVAGPHRAARERQAASVDTLVEQANESARKRLHLAGMKNIRHDMVFQTSDDPSFPGGPPPKE